MVSYHHFTLANGLQVLVHRMPESKVALLNIMYKVGSADESPHQTGIAHLFEHLMFSSSKHVPSYDKALQKVGGQNNAYTTFDVTNYYCVLPAPNLETAFWIESDRMFYLACTQEQLEVQRKVVIEEFNQVCYNKPYGDAWHHLLALAYRDCGYSWPTIGKEVKHIEEVQLADIEAFGKRFYTPSNAVLVVAGGVEVEEVKRLSQQWFGLGKAVTQPPLQRTTSLQQQKGKHHTVYGDVPFDVIYKAYHIPSRDDKQYLSLLLLAHLLGTGKSSFLYQKLVEELGYLTDLSVYTTEMLRSGLLIVEGELSEGTSFSQVEQAIEETIQDVCHKEIDSKLWQKAKNQLQSEYAFDAMNLFDKADSLAYATLVHDPDFFNQEVGHRLEELQPAEMQKTGLQWLNSKNGVVLYYGKK